LYLLYVKCVRLTYVNKRLLTYLNCLAIRRFDVFCLTAALQTFSRDMTACFMAVRGVL